MNKRAWLAATAAALVTSGAARSQEPPPLSAYGDLPSVEDMALSDSGNSLAIVATPDGQRKVMVMDAAGQGKYSALIGEAKVADIDWAGDDHVVLYTVNLTRLREGFTVNKAQLMVGTVLPIKGGPAMRVFGNNRLIVGSVAGRYGLRRIDGKVTGFYGGYALKQENGGIHRILDNMEGTWNGDPPHLFAYDFASGKARQVASVGQEGQDREWLVGPNGGVAAYYEDDEELRTWKIAVPGGPVLAQGNLPLLGGPQMLSLNANGSGVIYLVEDEDGNERYFDVSLAGGAPTPFLTDRTIWGILRHPDTGYYIGYIDADPVIDIVFNDPAAQAAVRKIRRAFPTLQVAIKDWSRDFRRFLVRTSGNKDSGTWYLVDVAQLQAKAVGYERVPIAPAMVGPVSTVAYRATDGLEMDGILTLPPGREAKGLSLVVLPHGGPASHDIEDFDWWAQAFASRGYAVFQPNFRGSTNQGVAFVRAGDGQWGRTMQTDISDGVAELTKRGVVDPKRACIVGASYGGYAALAGVTLQHGLYRCAVAVAPVADVEKMYNFFLGRSGDADDTWRGLKRQLGNPSGFDAISPAKHADAADAPILLIHGKDDTVVPIAQSEAMAAALKRANKPHELVVLPGEDHNLYRGETRKQMLTAAVAFVQKHNPAN